MASTDALAQPVKGEAWRVYGVITDTSGVPIGSLTSPSAVICRDGVTVATTNPPVNDSGAGGNIGGFILDLTATQMACDGGYLKITATNVGAVPVVIPFATQRPRALVSGLLPTDSYTMLWLILRRLFNNFFAPGTGSLSGPAYYAADDGVTPLVAQTLDTATGSVTVGALRPP